MQQKYWLILLLLLIPVIVLAQAGKIRGTVVDQKSKEPLIGANIVLEGTNLGAATDIDGNYIIINVPAGVYAVKASYVGYRSVSISNIRVNANITTDANFDLSSEDVQVQTVDIVAERPLIIKNATNTTRLETQEDIKNLPVRGVQNILALESGTVQQAGEFHVRGGRDGEVKYYIEGANVTNAYTALENVTVIQEALEEVQLQSGGYSADVSGGNSGAVRTSMRTGGEKLSFSVDVLTDDFAKPGEKFLGTTARGYRNAVVTIGGPLFVDALRFFVAGQHNYVRNKQSIFLTPFDFQLKTVSVSGAQPKNIPLPEDMAFKENYIYNNWIETDNGQGTLIFNATKNLKLRATGSYSEAVQKNNNWPNALTNLMRSKRVSETGTKVIFGSLRATYVVDANTFVEAQAGYQDRFQETYDPDFKSDWKKYADSAANAALGYTGFRSMYQGPLPYGIITDLLINHQNAPNNRYTKTDQSNFQGSLDFSSQVSKTFELKAGASAEMWTMRTFDIQGIANYMRRDLGTYYGAPASVWDSPEQRRIELAKFVNGNVNMYGYDIDGNETDVTTPAKKPVFGSAYVQTKFEYRDLILNLGGRLEYYDIDTKVPDNPADIASWYDPVNDIIDVSKLKQSKPFSLFLPRVSFSFPVSDNTVFFAQYGRYAQMPSLDQVYQGDVFVSRTMSPVSSGNAFLTPIGFLVTPEKTTQYEVGFQQVMGANVALTLSGYYKDLQDLITQRKYVNAQGNAIFNAYLNQDFGTVKGFEAKVEVRRVKRISAKLNYTFSQADGTGAQSYSSQGVVESNIFNAMPTFTFPLDYARTHSGSLIIDYRFAKGDGGAILEGFGLNAIMRFASGRPYTKIAAPSSLGQAQTFEFGVRPITDPRSRVPIEPLNSSVGPWSFSVDLSISKAFYLGGVTAEIYANVLNLFNTKNVNNVYPTTGSTEDDGWLSSPLAVPYLSNLDYVNFYKAANLNNRYFYLRVADITLDDMYGSPREIRVGVRVQM